MTREKEIKEAASEYAAENSECWDYDDTTGQYNESDSAKLADAFIEGATFADENPRKGLIEIEDVRGIYQMWLDDDNDNGDFLDYFADYCDKEGWT